MTQCKKLSVTRTHARANPCSSRTVFLKHLIRWSHNLINVSLPATSLDLLNPKLISTILCLFESLFWRPFVIFFEWVTPYSPESHNQIQYSLRSKAALFVRSYFSVLVGWLVSLFNSISTFAGYLIPKNSREEGKKFHIFPKFELASQHFSFFYAKENPAGIFLIPQTENTK